MGTLLIQSTIEHDDDGNPLFWSNTDGWVTRPHADHYTSDDIGTINLPDTGRWLACSR